MKKRLLAVVLAICMIASCCVLFAYATALTSDTYILVRNSEKNNYIKDISNSYKFTTKPSVKKKSTLSVNYNGSNYVPVTNDNYDSFVTVDPSGLEVGLKFGGSLTVSGDTASGDLTYDIADGWTLYYAPKNTDDETVVSTLDQYKFSGVEYLNKVKVVSKLLTITTGVRLSGADGTNLDADEIAQVEAEVTRQNGGQTVRMVTNSIYDLLPGDHVKLTAALKNPEVDGKFYRFSCWVNGDNSVYPGGSTISFDVEDSATLKAVFVETVNRYRITFSASDGGKIEVGTTDITKRETILGKGQYSVLAGKDIKFTLTPDEGYQVGKVIVTDNEGNTRNITSLVSLLTGATDWKTLIRATLTNTIATPTMEAESLGTPSYTFKNVQNDLSIDVTFIKQECRGFRLPWSA